MATERFGRSLTPFEAKARLVQRELRVAISASRVTRIVLFSLRRRQVLGGAVGTALEVRARRPHGFRIPFILPDESAQIADAVRREVHPERTLAEQKVHARSV